MTELIYHKNGYFTFKCHLWERIVTVKIMTDDRSRAEALLNVIADKLVRIDRNKLKIAKMLMDDHFSAMPDRPHNESSEEFTSALYISALRAELYKDGDVEIIFSVKSRQPYPLAVDYECELHDDNSFEI